MACSNCSYKGYLFAPILKQGDKSALVRCPVCKDDVRYSDAVRFVMGYPPIERGPAVILPFKPRSP